MNKITRFKQRRLREKVERIADKVDKLPIEVESPVTVAMVNNAKALLSAHEQIDDATARYMNGELSLTEIVDEINRIDKDIDERWQTVGC